MLLRPYFEGYRFTDRTDHDALKWSLNLTDSTAKLVRLQLRLSEFELDVFHHAVIIHQEADAISPVKATGIDQKPMDDCIPVLCSPLQDPTIQEAIMSYMHDNDENDDKEVVGLPAVYTISTSTESKTRQKTDYRARLYTRAGERHLYSTSFTYCRFTEICIYL